MPHIYLNASFSLKMKIVRRIALLMIEMRLRYLETLSMSLTRNFLQTWQNCGAQLPAGTFRTPATTGRDSVSFRNRWGSCSRNSKLITNWFWTLTTIFQIFCLQRITIHYVLHPPARIHVPILLKSILKKLQIYCNILCKTGINKMFLMFLLIKKM